MNGKILSMPKNCAADLQRKKQWNNYPKIIPKFSEKKKTFNVKKCIMAIFYSYILWSLTKNLASTL